MADHRWAPFAVGVVMVASTLGGPWLRPSPGAAAATPVCGPLGADTTWLPARNPYAVCSAGLTVPAGITLTIAPGVVVEGAAFALLQVDGKLDARGTHAAPITFSGVSKAPGAWSGVSIGSFLATSATAELEHVVIEYGGGSGGDALRLVQATARARDITVRSSGRHGVNVGAGARFEGARLRLLDNGAAAQGYPLVLGNLDVEPMRVQDLTVAGNGIDAIAVQGAALSGGQRWAALGVPYHVLGLIGVPAGAELAIDPGVELRFGAFAGLNVFGSLVAVGLPGRPITFTGMVASPGAWRGIYVQGMPPSLGTAVLDGVLVEHGGSAFSANIDTLLGSVVVENSIIRSSANHGVRVGTGSSATIYNSRVTANAGYAVFMDDFADTAIAANNWWGDATGPNVDGGCNPGGSGGRASKDVIFRPFLTAPGQLPDVLGAADAAHIAITPSKWFAPADPARPITLAVSLRGANGQPLADRGVQYGANLGVVEGGATTDAHGRATAYFIPLFPGEAEITASLMRGACESGRSAKTWLSLTVPPTHTLPGLTDGATPYATGNVVIEPLPIMAGVTVTLRISITNPLTTTIFLTGAFGVVGSGIGVPFPVISLIGNVPIAPGATHEFSAEWVPAQGGHTCVQFVWGYRRQGQPSCTQGCGPSGPGGGSSIGGGFDPGQWGVAQQNVQITPGPMKTYRTTTFLDTLKFFLEAYGSVAFVLEASALGPAAIPILLFQDQIMGNYLDLLFGAWNPVWCQMFGGVNCQGWNGPQFQYPGKFIGDLYSDPPRQDYTILAGVDVMTFTPAVASPIVPHARADAANRLAQAQLNVSANLAAAVVSFDRAAGAAEARDVLYNGLQTNAHLHYIEQTAAWMGASADAMDALADELAAEGFHTLVISPTAYAAYQMRLQAQGFNEQERLAARQVGFFDVGLDRLREYRLSVPYERVSGDMIPRMRDVAAGYRALAAELRSWPAFGDEDARSVSHARTSEASNLVRVGAVTSRFSIGNPLTRTATVALSVRRMDVPAGWMVTLSPVTVTLAPGTLATGTVTIVPGGSTVRATSAQIGVEGHIDGALLGGVVVEVTAPSREQFRAVKVHLPLVRR